MNPLLRKSSPTSIAAAALLAVGLASTALATPVVVFQADLNGNRGTANTGPVESGWTGISGTNTAAPWTNSYSINGIAISLAAASGNTGWRNDRAQLTVANVGALAPMFNSSVFAAGGFDVKMTGLTAGATYQFKLYATDTGNNVGDVHWQYSLAGDKTSPQDAGWVNQPGSTAFTPAANAGITQATKGIAMLSTTFIATGTAVDFFSIAGTVTVLSGFELYSVGASALAADAGADKSVSPSVPGIAIGANPVASGGTGPYTYSWSPATGLSSTTVSNPTASPAASTTYTVTVTDSLSATASDSVVVAYPLAALAGAAKVVNPASPSTTIGGSPTANGGSGPYSYSWSPATGLNDATLANPTASPTTTTSYTVTVTDAHSATATATVVVTYAIPDPNLISVDFVYSSGSTPVSGNTVLTSPANPATDPNIKNAAGLIYTGQVGSWNTINTGGNNVNNSSASQSNLFNGAGTATTVAFKMGTATSAGSSGGGWRNNGLGTIIPGSLRQEQAYVYYPALTASHYNWQLTGLDPGAHYQLTLFSDASSNYTNAANSVTPSRDSEGDWNWADIAADSAGSILGDFVTTGTNDVRGLYGLQILKLAMPLAASAGPGKAVSAGLPSVQIGGSPTAVGGNTPYTYSWSPATGLDDATLANPTAAPAATTLYTVTVTDALSATAQASVTVTYTTPPLAADAGPDKSLTPAAPSVQLGGTTGSAIGGFPSYTYSWTPTTGLSDPTVADPVASPTVPTTYTLTVTDAHSTIATDTVTVAYPLVVDAGADQIVTPDSPTVQLGGNPATYGGTEPLSYSWNPATGLDASNVAYPNASPTTTTIYTLTVTDALNVVVSDSVTITHTVPNPKLISLDFVYTVSGSVPYSGNTTLTGTVNKNAAGEIYSGQVGPWNAIRTGGNNANNGSASATNLLNGAGAATTIAFKMGTAATGGSGGWRNNYVPSFASGNLRQEQTYIYTDITPNHFSWELAGLTPYAHYRLTLFGDGGASYTNTANSVPAVVDAEGDWNWTDITADAAGVIEGNYATSASNQIKGLYGLQLEFVSASTGTGYDNWASLHAGGQTASEDFNHDGVQNGIAYFMGINGLASNPAVVNGKVTWPHVGAVSAFEVQVSDDLVTWVPAAPADVDTATDPAQVVYTLPTGASQKFCRLLVTP